MRLGVWKTPPLAVLSAAVCVMTLATTVMAQQQPTTISGRITTREGAQPLAEARVIAVGTTVFTTSNAEGRYTLRGVPAGNIEVRVLRVGYQEQKRPVTVTAGQAVTLDFQLDRTLIVLQEVVTTATGEQRRVELGNTVATIDVAKVVEAAPIKNMGDLLVAKAAGVQVLPANMTAGGSRVRIRGTSSISLNNDPIYVIDGIRMTSDRNSTAIGVGGTAPSRVNDINPEEIENIEVVKGPSAATLYGTDAANGVIVITTKKGRAGRPSWNLYGDYGVISDRNEYPTMYAILGHAPATPTVTRKCLRKDLALGTCIMDSTTALNVFNHSELTPIADGNRNQLGLQVGGGSENVRYFLSGDYERETGPFEIPDFERQRFDSLKIGIRDEWERPNTLKKGSYRANINAAINQSLDVSAAAGYTHLDQRLPQVDNNVNSFWYNGTVGPGFQGAGPGYTGVGSLGQPLRGYANFTPGDIFQDFTNQGAQRFIGSVNGNWRPTTWLQNRLDAGVDLTNRVDTELCRFGQCADFSTNRQGFSDNARANIRNITFNFGSTASWQPRPWVNLKTTGGVQFVNYKRDENDAFGAQLPPGAQTPGQATIPSASASTVLQKTLGLFVEEAVAFRDRLFATVAVRTDQNSAFGTNFQRVYYPKASLSWILSEEGFFPTYDWLGQLRLRAALGASGVQPGPNDADRTFAVTTTSIANTDISGLRSSQLGNPDLKPERSTELEAGFDARGFGNRANLEFTYYRKQTKDALVNMVLAPSAGTAVTSQLTNLAAVKNYGMEALLNLQLIDRRAAAWDATISASHNKNKLVSLGTDAAGKPIPTIGAANIRQAEGYPINSVWTRKFTYSDANGDGVIVPAEVSVDTAFTYKGYSQPKLELSLNTGVELLNRQVRLTALVDHKADYVVLNNEQGFLCQQSTSCRGTSSLDASLWEQARAVAIRDGVPSSNDGYYEKPDFWRIREVSATYNLPANLAERYLRVRGASVNVAARNLKVWSDWTGVDPEQNYNQGDTQITLLTAGPPTYYTARFILRF